MSDSKSNADPEDEAQCFIDLEEIDSKIAKLRQKKGTTIARYEGLGVDVEAIRACQKLKRKDNPPNWVLRLRKMAQKLLIIPTEEEIGGQLSMMPALPSKEKQERIKAQDAFWKGWDAGAAGQPLDDNPFSAAPGSEEYVQWRDGWADGLSEKKPRDEAVAAKKARKKEDKKSANSADAPTEVRAERRKRTGRTATAAPETPVEKDEAAFRAPPAVH